MLHKKTLPAIAIAVALLALVMIQRGGAPSGQPVPSVSTEIHVEYPPPAATVNSPLLVRGRAAGTWFFEADFPVQLVDPAGAVITQGVARAMDDWMTEALVPFQVTLEFPAPRQDTVATLILEKNDPSGLKAAETFEVPVRLKKNEERYDKQTWQPEPEKDKTECVVTGCSNQVCADEEVITTCEFLPEYECYADAVCERQKNGACGWTMTDELKTCLSR